MPYYIENNNISFIIAFNNDSTNLFFYFYNFDLNDGVNEPKITSFNNMNIQNKMIKCEINYYSTLINCFYYSKTDTQNYVSSKLFLIKNMNIIEESLKIYNNGLYGEIKQINQIKSARSYNDNFFVCFLSDRTPICLINNNKVNEFKEIECQQTNGWNAQYKVFYFNETNDFMLISKQSLDTTIFNNKNNELKKCDEHFLPRQTNEYSIIYINDYQVVNALNFSGYFQLLIYLY